MAIKKYIGIDLGTDSTRVYLKKIGVIINEPTIVAFNNRTNRIVAHGVEAKKMLSRTPAHITAMRPIVHGVIGDFDMAREFIQKLLRDKKLPWSWLTETVVSVPTNLTEVERKSVEDLLKEANVNQVYLIEQPIVSAIGSRLNVEEPTAHLMVDIGAGTTDMAIISMNGIVVSKRLKIAGDYLNNEIIKGVREELKLLIGEPTAEEMKIAVGSAMPLTERLEVVVRGRDMTTGLPREIIIKDTQVRNWLSRPLKVIIESIKDLIEMTPPELVGDIYKNGVYLSGGGSLLRGIGELTEKEVGVSVRVVEDPMMCVSRGIGTVTENIEGYHHLLNSFGKPRM